MIQEYKRRTNTTVLAAIMVAFVVLLMALYWRPPNRKVPEQLVGEWRTSDPKYSDRQLDITYASISFTTGDGTVSTGFIKEIKAVQNGASTLYTVVYDLEGTSNELSFYYEMGSAKVGVIRFKNQQAMIWTKIENS
jgi:hypothetical protein